MTTTLRRLLLAGGLAAALGSSAALAGCGDRPVDHGNMGEPTPSPAATTGAALQPSTDAAAVDAAFVRQMIPHHEMALEMATAVADSVSHQEIEDLADDVIEAQTKEIATLRARPRPWASTRRTRRRSSRPTPRRLVWPPTSSGWTTTT